MWRIEKPTVECVGSPAIPVHIVYPSARHVSAKVKSFVEYVQQRMTPPPRESGPVP
jgi:DNA-binding transcriptional LysR family regulator